MSESTVKAHVKQIIRRLNVANRTQAALLATRSRHAGHCPQAKPRDGYCKRLAGRNILDRQSDARPAPAAEEETRHVRADRHPHFCPSAGRAKSARPTISGSTANRSSTLTDFWAEHGKRIDWIKPFTKVSNAAFEGDVHIAWYEDGTLNASYNCIDRHLPKRAEQTAILWEGDDPGEDRRVTYRELHEAVCRLANVAEGTGCPQGRSGHDLSPDDPRGGGRDARLRSHRRDPFGRLRRLLTR